MPILYSNPSEVGADRIVNAIAAFEQYGGNGRPLIVCDFGTATTLDAVSAKGEYLGGAICPGVTISADALFQRSTRRVQITEAGLQLATSGGRGSPTALFLRGAPTRQVLVLIDGLLAASGTPQEVALDATVRSRYLGRGFQAEDVHA